jgi:hypothetical protein
MTTFDNKVSILSELWLDYRQDEEFQDFVEYNDIGLPLAYAIANDIVKPTDIATRFIEETYDLLLAGIGIEDGEFETLTDVLTEGEE